MKPTEFDCCECGSHIVDIAAATVREPPLCAMCLMLPGWFCDNAVRALIDSEHEVGIEPRWRGFDVHKDN